MSTRPKSRPKADYMKRADKLTRTSVLLCFETGNGPRAALTAEGLADTRIGGIDNVRL